jgi:hypothetical protein
MSRLTWKTLAAVAVAGGLLTTATPAQTPAPNPAELPKEPITEARPLPPYPATGSHAAPEPTVVDDGSGQFSGYGANYVDYGQGAYGYGSQFYGQKRSTRVPPYYNWMRPVRRPIWRVPVVYQQYWPTHHYTGGPVQWPNGAAPLPVVYQPTDTTQLGVYYQQVPMWQPNPGMLPPAPWPWDWHHTMPAQVYYNRGDWRDPNYVRARYGAYDASGGYPPGMTGPAQGEHYLPANVAAEEAPATE